MILYVSKQYFQGQTRVLFDEEEEEDDEDDDDDDDEGDNDIETVMAATPAHSIMEPPQNGVSTVPSQNGVTSGLKQNRVTAETFDRSPCSESEMVQSSPQSSTNETHILKVQSGSFIRIKILKNFTKLHLLS